MSIDDDIAASKAAKPGDLAAIETLAKALDELAETQRVTRLLQNEAALALGAHLRAHPRSERTSLLPGWRFSTERVAAAKYDSPMVRSRVASELDDIAVTVNADGEKVYPPPSEVLRHVWPLVGAHTAGFSGWKTEAMAKLGIPLMRYRLDEPEDDGPVKGRAVRLTPGQTAPPEETEAP